MSATWREPSGNRNHRDVSRRATAYNERRRKEDRVSRDAVCWLCHKEFIRPKGNTDSLCPPCLRNIQ